MTSEFGERLREERERHGVTQAEVAVWTSITRQTQSSYEKEPRYPDALYLKVLLEHGFDVTYLLTGERAPRYGAISTELLKLVFIKLHEEVETCGLKLNFEKQAALFALVYQTACDTGVVDDLVVQKAVALSIL